MIAHARPRIGPWPWTRGVQPRTCWGAALPSGRADKLNTLTHAAPAALLALALAACAVPAPPETTAGRPGDLRRSGSVSDRTGAAVPLALCARSAGLARAVGLPPALLRLPAACGAAGRL